MISTIAIDDEPLALKIIEDFTSKSPIINLIGTFTNTDLALNFIKNNELSLIFLDINMPSISGIELSEYFKNKKIIFTTAHSEFALQAFDLQAVDYLLKPLQFERFQIACQKAYREIEKKEPVLKEIFVKDGLFLKKIILENVLYIESDKNYLSFIELNKKTLTRMTIGEILGIIPKEMFVRIHKSYIINLSSINRIFKNQIILNNGKTLPVSATYHNVINNITE